jgi:hypothetical protein
MNGAKMWHGLELLDVTIFSGKNHYNIKGFRAFYLLIKQWNNSDLH